MRDFLIKNISDHLQYLGLSEAVANIYALKGCDHYESSVCNSKDAFKDACDFAGSAAQNAIHGFKYKSPKAAVKRRAKKPKEAFDFNGL